MKRFNLRYLLLTSHFSQIGLPLAFWLLFIVIGALRGETYIVDTARAYLGAVIPLTGGIMAAYAILDDPALELRFAAPVSSLQNLAEGLVPVFLVQAFLAMTYQLYALAFKADFSTILCNTFGQLQLVWLIPTVSLMALGCCAALVFTQSAGGALMAGMVWLVQLVARSWFAELQIGRYFLIFMSPFMLDHPALRTNQITLAVTSCFLIYASWALLKRQERYI